MTPQLLITLDPTTGKLQAELPGTMATRRKLPLDTAQAGETLLRILNAQLEDRTELGTDGAPTKAQLRHWEDHGQWPSSSCRFCLAEGLAKPETARVRKAYSVNQKRSDGVEIRQLKPGQSAKHRTLASKKTTDALGL